MLSVSAKECGDLVQLRKNPSVFQSIDFGRSGARRILTNSWTTKGKLDTKRSFERVETIISLGMIIERAAREMRLKEMFSTQHQDDLHEEHTTKGYFVDDSTGIKLNERMVLEGRKLEMETFKEMKVYDYIKRDEVKKNGTGKTVGVRWVDVLKNDVVRSRLVAQ